MTEWNIEGIAEEVISEMKEDDADIDNLDYYIRHIAYWSIFSREPEAADEVCQKVKELVLELYD